jgi:hypothetical protein
MEHRLDFSQFQSIASEFKLPIGSSLEINKAVWKIPTNVTTPVQAIAWDKRILDEAFRSKFGTIPVSRSNSIAACVEFSPYTDGNWIQS